MTIEYRCCSGTSLKPCCVWSNGCNIVGTAIPLFRAGSAWDFLSWFCYLLTGWMAKATSVQNLWQPRECQEQEGKGQLWGWCGITHSLPSSAVLWSPALWGIGAPVTEASCLWPPQVFPLSLPQWICWTISLCFFWAGQPTQQGFSLLPAICLETLSSFCFPLEAHSCEALGVCHEILNSSVSCWYLGKIIAGHQRREFSISREGVVTCKASKGSSAWAVSLRAL